MLVLKSIAGAIFLILMMSLSLFLPFGSIKYSLAWSYLAVFFLSVFCITTYLYLFDKRLLKSRLSVGLHAEKRQFQKIIQLISGLVFISIFIVSAFDYRYNWSSVPLYLSYIGNILCGLAFTYLFFVFKHNPFLSATVEIQENQKVISTGLYAMGSTSNVYWSLALDAFYTHCTRLILGVGTCSCFVCEYHYQSNR